MIKVAVDTNRLAEMTNLTKLLSNLGAVYDPNAAGSSIGAVKVGKVKILIKSSGRSAGLDVEARAMTLLHETIVNAVAASGGPITITMPHRTVKGVVGVRKTPGTPKSDFHCVDKSNKALIFISHKKGSKPTDFQQWGGVTEKEIADHNLVREFATHAKAEFGDVMPSGASLAAELPSDNESYKLKMFSIYGVKSLTKQWGVDCVDVLIQGDPGLLQVSKGVFKLTATGHIHYHGDIPGGGFEPTLALIYKGDRTNLGIKGARASIYPKAGRSFKKIIKL
jgi:hypothetical protein